MENNLISKKELLEMIGISYGQLYRWKRKQLIPEEWFIRKSTFTGQETFFPREEILARIEKIKNMKEDLSLDDISEVFSPKLDDIKISINEVIEKEIASNVAIEIAESVYGKIQDLSFEQTLFLYTIQKVLLSGDVTVEEAKNIFSLLNQKYSSFQDAKCELIYLRKFGVGLCTLISQDSNIAFEQGIKVILKINMAAFFQELKLKLKF